MYPDIEDRVKVDEQLEKFKKAEGMFGMSMAILTRDKKQPALWWKSYEEECKELQKQAIRVLSLTCSATGCERNWSTFDHVHSKKRNRLEQQRLNALVFVKYNIQLELRQIKRQERGETYDPIYLSDMESDDEWITEKEDPCLPEDHSWMDIQECFEDDEGTTSKKRKRGPRNLNAIDRGKRKVFEDDDEVELIEGREEEEEEEEEFDEVTMVDDDEDDIDLGDNED
ncbi:adenylate kinase isoenzyme 6 homolog HBR1-like [Camellia sinensis]|uniref:adenylate kinase isoenzyme 6 homolog HBR1-like n=1 Tax=Camellia sinensis TaxID=4442 RepID=UPI001036E7F6|nr:adenylate kinase isoenzyme 6 homolog HBR1-like [Camellia sinensis]